MKQLSISQETVELLRQGNHKAFETVFHGYFNRIKVFIYSYVKSEEDAVELAEDLFVNLWLNHRKIDAEKSFSAFLHTMARNASLNFLKHQEVHENYLSHSSYNDKSYTSEDDLIAKETALLIEMAVEKMPEKRKQVYLLSRVEGLNNEEIALRLGISKSNVESLLSLALKDIRKAILLSLFTFFLS